MNKTSFSRISSTSSLDQPKEADKNQSVEKKAQPAQSENNTSATTSNSGHSASIVGEQSGSAVAALSSKSFKSDAGAAIGWQPNLGTKDKPEINHRILPSSDPILSPRASSSIKLATNRSILKAEINKSTDALSASPLPMSAQATTVSNKFTTASSLTTQPAISVQQADKKMKKTMPSEIASALIKAESAKQGVPYKREMTPGVVQRVLREKIMDKGVNIIESMLLPFVESQFGNSEYGDLFRAADKKYINAQAEIENLRKSIKAGMQNPNEFSDAMLQKDPRLESILDSVMKPLLSYVTSDDTIEGSKLPAPFLQLLKAVDNEILVWQKSLAAEAKHSGGISPTQADVDTIRNNAIVALIANRSLSVMLNKSHGSQAGGMYMLIENYMIKTINKKLVNFTKNVMQCPDDKFEKLLVQKRVQQITRKSSMRMKAPDEDGDKSPRYTEKKSQLAIAPNNPDKKISKAEPVLENIAGHNQTLVTLFVRKYKLNEIDPAFSLIFQKTMSKYSEEGVVNLGEKAIKKECLKLLGQHMTQLQQSGQVMQDAVKNLFEKLSGYSFSELIEAPLSPRGATSPRAMPPKKS